MTALKAKNVCAIITYFTGQQQPHGFSEPRWLHFDKATCEMKPCLTPNIWAVGAVCESLPGAILQPSSRLSTTLSKHISKTPSVKTHSGLLNIYNVYTIKY